MNRTARTRIRRLPARAVYEQEQVEAILDAMPVAHLAFCLDGQPFAIPTLQARVEQTIYMHGSAASRTVKALAEGIEVCLAVTLYDGIVLARSAFHHSVNYRSATVFGKARLVEGEAERLAALEAFTERLLPGRWAEVRQPSRRELKGVSVLALPLQECVAKARSGPPQDEEQDLGLDVWAGVVPLHTVAGPLLPDPGLRDGLPISPAALRLLDRD
ncbi:MAG TPA: pyridoxamine 5'-phosphate oxidase family protein [Solirubrobacteraceae bacterium]|jgi:hypothetical protein